MKNISNLFNIIGFQASWWSCVLGVKYGWPYFGPLIMAIFLLAHYSFFKVSLSEINFIVIAGFVGTIVDTIFLQSTLITYYGLTFSSIAPFWIIAMWLGFAATINHSLAWINGRWLISFIMGAVFGPLSYLAGIKFDALYFEQTFSLLLLLSLVWGLIVPALVVLNNKIILNK